MQLKTSAPGSLMLLGEYGVLHGQHALICAVDKYIRVLLSPRTDERIEIFSAKYHRSVYTTFIKQLTIEPPFQFVLAVLKYYQSKLTHGCTIEIESDFSAQMGLGSSAAVTVAILSALTIWLGIHTSLRELVRIGRLIVRRVQGVGSGADVAASVYGGIIGYRVQPLTVEQYPVRYPLTALYAGFKTPTAVAIKQVYDRFAGCPQIFRQICRGIGQCGLAGMQLVRQQDWQQLGKIMTVQQGLLTALGVNTPLLQDMVDSLCAQTMILGAKISGSGLGDCVIGLGDLPDMHTRYASAYHHTALNATVQRITVQMTAQGVQCEKV
jgi:mevalonate kinase